MQVTAAAQAYNTLAPVPVTLRSHAQVTALLGGQSLVAPGVVPVSEWRLDSGMQARRPADLYAGVARVSGHDPQATLESLAAALDPGEFATAMVTGTGRRPCLTVTSRCAGVEESIYVDRSSYWSGSAGPLGAAGDPLAAAHKVAAALRAVPPSAHNW